MNSSLSSAARCMNGTLYGEDLRFAGVSTDSRSIASGALFFALQGPNFDGHDYVEAAHDKGAAGAVVSCLCDCEIAQLKVDDAKQALGRFAAAWRRSKRVRVVAITGSNGKTTLKELVAACLVQQAPTLATQGNLNNDIGMPLMLSRINDNHEFAVLEMGANHAGEIAYLASLADVDIAAITNAGAAHLEGFGSIEGVARAKGEILQGEYRPKLAVLNADDDYFEYWQSLVEDVRTLSFGFAAAADIRASNIDATVDGSTFSLHLPTRVVDVDLPLVGIHNVRNACAAAAIATALDVSAAQIKLALESAMPVDGRLQPLAGLHGCILFNDTYNANPLSVIAAAEFLAALDGNSWFVLGDMKELGEDAEALHREVGASARACGVDRLFALGELSRHCVEGFGDGAKWYPNLNALLADLSTISADVNVLIKGSRCMRMERVVDAMRSDAAERDNV